MNIVPATPVFDKAHLRLSLAWQFAIVGAFVLAAGMILIGLWVTSRIEEAAIRNAAGTTALYVDSVIAPLARELSTSASLSQDARHALTDALKTGALSSKLFSFKIWSPDSTVLFSSAPELIGERFPMHPGLAAALAGSVHAAFDPLRGAEHRRERQSALPLLEIYSPIREPWSGQIVAVAEFYEIATDLHEELGKGRIESWLVVGGVTLGMMAFLYIIVARGSRLIDTQRRSLDAQVIKLSKMLEANRRLRLRADKATQRTATLNERYLRRIAAELHDGPTQLLGFAALRLETISKGRAKEDDEDRVKTCIAEAIREIRNICRGLSLPELGEMSGDNVVRRAIRAHETHARRKIETDIGAIDVSSQAVKICIYRFLQETLSNAARHAHASRVDVTARQDNRGIQITVRDNGAGFVRESEGRGLGLAGLEERLAGLGGRLGIESAAGSGTIVEMVLPSGDDE